MPGFSPASFFPEKKVFVIVSHGGKMNLNSLSDKKATCLMWPKFLVKQGEYQREREKLYHNQFRFYSEHAGAGPTINLCFIQ